MNRLRETRVIKNYKQSDIAKILNITQPMVSAWENGIYQIDNDSLAKLADFYNVSVDYLLGREVMSESPSTTKGVKIPILGRVIAGIPMEAIENIEGQEEITPAMAAKGEYFALRVKGASMEPLLREGDVVIVRKQESVESGDVAIVMVNGNEATIKKINYQDNGITLVAYNVNVYEPHFYCKEDVVNLPILVAGKVVESRHKFE